jgi:hypothetical protein
LARFLGLLSLSKLLVCIGFICFFVGWIGNCKFDAPSFGYKEGFGENMNAKSRYEEVLDSIKNGDRKSSSHSSGLKLRFGADAIALSVLSSDKYPSPPQRVGHNNPPVRKPRVSGTLSQLRSGDSLWARGMHFVDTFFAESAEHTWLLVPVFLLSFVVGTSLYPDFYYSWLTH